MKKKHEIKSRQELEERLVLGGLQNLLTDGRRGPDPEKSQKSLFIDKKYTKSILSLLS
jgi:hypothetical protein